MSTKRQQLQKGIGEHAAQPNHQAITDQSQNEDGLWSAKTAAEFCELKPVTILRAFRRGDLLGFKVTARLVRFRRRDVLAWLDSGRVGNAEAA